MKRSNAKKSYTARYKLCFLKFETEVSIDMKRSAHLYLVSSAKWVTL